MMFDCVPPLASEQASSVYNLAQPPKTMMFSVSIAGCRLHTDANAKKINLLTCQRLQRIEGAFVVEKIVPIRTNIEKVFRDTIVGSVGAYFEGRKVG